MNRELIEKRKGELQRKLEQVQANGNALVGAIEDCEYWLAQLAKEGSTETSSRSQSALPEA